MSEDLVNQITLNFLISKNQLQKLNKKLNEKTENNRNSDKEIYKDKIQNLFIDLLRDNPPDGLLQEVKTGFDFFLDKCIYYFKSLEHLNDERLEELDIEDEDQNIKEEEDEEKDDEDDEDDDDDDDDEDVKETKNNKFANVDVKPKYYKKTNNSEGVENIQQLPLNWFQNVRQNYKKNKIIPRKKEIIIDDNFSNYEKKKI